jgi:hypothetical protein
MGSDLNIQYRIGVIHKKVGGSKFGLCLPIGRNCGIRNAEFKTKNSMEHRVL